MNLIPGLEIRPLPRELTGHARVCAEAAFLRAHRSAIRRLGLGPLVSFDTEGRLRSHSSVPRTGRAAEMPGSHRLSVAAAMERQIHVEQLLRVPPRRSVSVARRQDALDSQRALWLAQERWHAARRASDHTTVSGRRRVEQARALVFQLEQEVTSC